MANVTGRRIRVGTRGSALARRQTELVIGWLRGRHPDVEFVVEIIRTAGDVDQDRALSQFDSQGVFVHAIEQALRDGRIDVAVHSSKDMPSELPPGLELIFPPREDPRDALVSREGVKLTDLPTGARIGTGSPRRRALLLYLRPDLEVVPIRGNVDTRVHHAHEGDLDGVVVAAAGMRRLGRQDQIAELLPPDLFIPAVGQGILAVELRSDDRATRELCSVLDDAPTRAAAEAERQVAITVGAGCQTAIGAYAEVRDGELSLSAFLALNDEHLIWAALSGPAPRAQEIGRGVGRQLVEKRATMLAQLGGEVTTS